MTSPVQAAVHDSIDALDRDAWNALNPTNNPFLRHEFLLALERHSCVGSESGWRPAIVTLARDGRLVAAAPAYLKSHSYGEFVFDFAWAQAYSRYGLDYYPKLVVGVPFTPASGPRLLVAPGADAATLRGELVQAIANSAPLSACSSVHALFLDPDARAAFGDAGWLARRDVQFHWHNRGYRHFDDYLATFTADKRKKAKRERRRVAEDGVTFATLLGRDIEPRLLDFVYALHRRTFLLHGHEPYLTREFFRAIPSVLGEQFMVKVAQRAGEPVAAAVFFWHEQALYGRYWGCAENFHSLHFETCYHQGIEFCIERGIERFEPGTQGEHKVSRGFEPVMTASAHWIADSRFRSAIGDYVTREAEHADAYAQAVRAHVPYREARRAARAADEAAAVDPDAVQHEHE